MSKAVFELNLAGLNQLMKSAEMQRILAESAIAVEGAAGDGYEGKVKVATWTALAKIYPITGKAARDNVKNNTLLKALSAGKV